MRNIVCASLLALLYACGNDNGDGAGTPDSGTMQCVAEANFTWLHDNIFSTNRCAIAGCHAESFPQGDLNFKAGKAAVHSELLGGTFNVQAQGTFPTRVVMNDAAMSYLYEKVSKETPLGGTRMPVGPPLLDCEIQAISDWIEAGAPND
jgi:hypothetical protein